MNYDEVRKLNPGMEPSNDELREIEEHLSEYIDDED